MRFDDEERPTPDPWPLLDPHAHHITFYRPAPHPVVVGGRCKYVCPGTFLGMRHEHVGLCVGVWRQPDRPDVVILSMVPLV